MNTRGTNTRIAAGLNPIAVAVEPRGRYLYVANWGAHNISGYRIQQPSGLIEPISEIPFPSGRWPHSIAIAASGRFLYTANGDSNDVSAYRIEMATGVLEPLSGSPSPAR